MARRLAPGRTGETMYYEACRSRLRGNFGSRPALGGAIERRPSCNDFSEPLVPTYFLMFFPALFKATSGLARPLVAISSAAFIELQNLPICGIFGITTPFRTFSYVPLMRELLALISSARDFSAGTPSGASASMAFKPSAVQTYF